MSSHHFLNSALIVGLSVAGVAAQEAEPVTSRDVAAVRDDATEGKLFRGGNLLGVEVLDADHEGYAEVRDALLDRQGRVRALLLAVSDVEDSLVLAPAAVVMPFVPPTEDPALSDELEPLTLESSAVHDFDALVLTVDAGLLRGAPRVADDSLDMPITAARVASAYEHFGYDVPESLAVHASADESAEPTDELMADDPLSDDTTLDAEIAALDDPATPFCRVSKLIGTDVTNTEEEDLGNVGDLAISLADDRVAYAVLDFGGTLGLGEKRFAVPFQALIPHPSDDDQLVLGVSAAVLEERDGFESWPHAADTTLFPATPRPLQADDVALGARKRRR